MRQPTPLQQAASRANGAKSRGPKTAAGKRRSSRNGCKHRLFSRVAPLPPADDPEFLENLARYQPRTFEAESAILSLAVNMWLKMRLWPVYTEMWKAEILRQAALHPDEEPAYTPPSPSTTGPCTCSNVWTPATAAKYSAPSTPSKEKKTPSKEKKNLPCAPIASVSASFARAQKRRK